MQSRVNRVKRDAVFFSDYIKKIAKRTSRVNTNVGILLQIFILSGSPLLQFEVEPGTVSLQESSKKVVDSDEMNTDNRTENKKKTTKGIGDVNIEVNRISNEDKTET